MPFGGALLVLFGFLAVVIQPMKWLFLSLFVLIFIIMMAGWFGANMVSGAIILVVLLTIIGSCTG